MRKQHTLELPFFFSFLNSSMLEDKTQLIKKTQN